MRIKSVELINLRSYENTTLEFSEGINILIGANNSGKSTVIHALMNLQYHTFRKEDIRALTSYSKIYTKVEGISEKDCDSFYHNEDHQAFKYGEKFTVVWGLSENGSQPEDSLYFDSDLLVQRVEHNKLKLKADDGLKDINWMHFPRFSDKENANNFIYPFLAKRKTNSFNSTVTKEDTFRVDDSLRNLAAKIQKINNPTHPQHSRFTDLCMEVLGFKIGVIPIESNNGIEPGIYVSDTSLIAIRSMGEGVSNITGFLVTLLTENNKLYLIEELENDIHPKALKKLLPLIVEKSRNNQFVISTHSHIVLKYLGAIPECKIFYTSWSPINSLNEKVPTSIIERIDNTPEKRLAILEKLGYDFFDFELFDFYLILEESTAELVIRDFLIPNFVPHLYNRLRTIAAAGTDDLESRVIDFIRLFVFIHTSPAYYKKAWVIADGDETGKNCINNLQEKFKTWPKNHFITLKNDAFENYYPERFNSEVESVLAMPHGQKKQLKKKELVLKVMEWAFSNRNEAVKEFKTSAKEVIDLLKIIGKSVKNKK